MEKAPFRLPRANYDGETVDAWIIRRLPHAGECILERTSIRAIGTASLGTGISLEKGITGSDPDQVGWVAVGQGAFAGVVAEFKAVQIDLFDGANDSPFAFEAAADIGVGVSLGGEISLDPGGQLEISFNLGLGLGEHASFSPTLNVDVGKPPESAKVDK